MKKSTIAIIIGAVAASALVLIIAMSFMGGKSELAIPESVDRAEHLKSEVYDPAAERQYQVSLKYSEQGNYIKAVEALERALRNYSGPKSFHYYELMGFLATYHLILGNESQAEQLLEEVEKNYERLLKEAQGDAS